jgi:biotin carboxyl carrier protein
MRGTIVELPVLEGATVTAGAVLFTVEAMKMENEVRAPCDGVITGIQAHPGDSVAAGATVMRVIPAKQR